MAELKYEIIEDFGIIEEHPSSNRALTLRLVSWNNRKPKIEIREINMENGATYKGIGFYSKQGLKNLLELLNKIDLETSDDIETDNRRVLSSEELLKIEE